MVEIVGEEVLNVKECPTCGAPIEEKKEMLCIRYLSGPQEGQIVCDECIDK